MQHELLINGKKTIVLIPENDLELLFLDMKTVSVEITQDITKILGKPIPKGSLIIQET